MQLHIDAHSFGWVQLLVAAITLLNNLVSDEDVRLTVINQLSAQKGNHLQVHKIYRTCIISMCCNSRASCVGAHMA